MWTTDKVAEELKREKIVIFAKGTAQAPRCGFSARAIDVMGRFNRPLHVVDVLSDPSIRPALVEFSSWPTTPQVYLDGTLLGGSDIIQEMFESGDLQQKIADSFGETYEPVTADSPITLTPSAVSKVKEFLESSADKLRLNAALKSGEVVFELEIDTQSHPQDDTKYAQDGIEIVHRNSMRKLFDKLTVDWVEQGESAGFAVNETGTAPAIPRPLDITQAQLSELAKNHDETTGKFWLVDVREQDEWDAGHAESAVFLPLSNLEKAWEKVGFDKQDTIVMYCKRGGRSTQAANFFRDKLGFSKTQSLVGGFSQVPEELK